MRPRSAIEMLSASWGDAARSTGLRSSITRWLKIGAFFAFAFVGDTPCALAAAALRPGSKLNSSADSSG